MGTETRPRNVEATKELLLAAATAEFAEHGLAGGRIDRIAERAGVNKRLIYVYFGNKEQLFDAIVSRSVAGLNDAVPFDATDLPGHAGSVFDYFLANPQVLRVLSWRDFEHASPTEVENDAIREKLARTRAAQRAGVLNADIPALDLLAIAQRMVTSWLGATMGLRGAAPGDPMSPRRLREHRRALVDAVRRVAEPRKRTRDPIRRPST
jgi:AcrR family transcriptional regulator